MYLSPKITENIQAKNPHIHILRICLLQLLNAEHEITIANV